MSLVEALSTEVHSDGQECLAASTFYAPKTVADPG
jgi:hypothetical protein